MYAQQLASCCSFINSATHGYLVLVCYRHQREALRQTETRGGGLAMKVPYTNQNHPQGTSAYFLC